MATRVVTGPIVDAEGAPWPGFELTFRVHPATYTTTATVPYADVTVTTDEAGDFAVTLITGITYEVRLVSAFITRSSSHVIFPQGTVFAVVVPEGEGSISLADLQALGNVPVTPPQAASIIATWMDDQTATLEALNDAAQATAGKSAYELAVLDGFEGTEAEWLASLHGADGVMSPTDVEAVIQDYGAVTASGAVEAVTASDPWGATQSAVTVLETKTGTVLQSDGSFVDAEVAAAAVREGMPERLIFPLSPPPKPTPASTLATFAASESWTVNSSYTDAAYATDWFLAPTSIKMDLVTGYRLIDKDGMAVNPDTHILRLWVKQSRAGAVRDIWFRFGVGGSFTNSFSVTRDILNPTTDWQPIDIDIRSHEGSSSGSPVAADMNFMRIHARLKTGEADASICFGGIQLVPRISAIFPKGVVSITFDDNWLTQFTYAFPMMQTRGMRGTQYTIVDGLGSSANHMTEDQLRILHGAGWDVQAHALTYATHNAGFPNVSTDVMHREFYGMREWAARKGFGACEHLAWPMGQTSTVTEDIAAEYFQSTRTASMTGKGLNLELPNPYTRRSMRTRYPDDGDTAAAADLAYTAEHGRWMIYVIHGVEVAQLAVAATKFTAILDAIEAEEVPVLPVSEVFKALM